MNGLFRSKADTARLPPPRCQCCAARLGYEASSLAEVGMVLLCDRCLFRFAVERAQQVYGVELVPSAERAVSA